MKIKITGTRKDINRFINFIFDFDRSPYYIRWHGPYIPLDGFHQGEFDNEIEIFLKDYKKRK